MDEWLLVFNGQIRPTVFAILEIVIALAVTTHVLLTKRDVGSAIGWIGLGWLAPIVGGPLYFVFGINRVQRRARSELEYRGGDSERDAVPPALQRDDYLAPLEHAARWLTSRPMLLGNGITLLRNGDAAYPPMLAAIAGAQRSVALSTYILRNDKAGGRFIQALIAAKARGCEVRVLIDGIGGGWFTSGAYRRLHAAGVPVARFMHSFWPWRMPFLNLRTHKKVLVVDGTHGFAGGMNIGRENVLALRPRHPVRDSHFAFEGPIVGQLTDAFARDWEFVTGAPLEGELWFPSLAHAGDGLARVITSGPDQDIGKIETVMMQAIACARDSVVVVTPYFLPDERMLSALALASMRAVSVDVIVPEHSNYRIVDRAMRAHVRPLLRAGGRIWLAPSPFDHSKIMVVDRRWCLVGSSNWDMRSLRLNFELNVEVYQDALAAQLTALARAKQVRELTLDDLQRRRLAVRLLDAALRLLLPYV